jgi:hypothetical protein
MITKAQALAFRQNYIDTLPDRLDALIKLAAISGQTTVTMSYQPAADAVAQNFVTNTAIPAGWTTSSVDTIGKTITIAP